MKLNVVDIKGKSSGAVTVDDAIWGADQNRVLVAQSVRVYQSNLRHGSGGSKNRSDVSRSGRKMWKQKGTGRARHGDRTAPQFVGGAKAHGPTGQENYKLRINRKMRQGALWSVLSDVVRGGRIMVIDGLPEVKKTRELAGVIQRLTAGVVLLVVDKPNENLVRAARNLDKVTLARPEELNALMVLEHERLVITKEAAKEMGVKGQGLKAKG